LVWITVLPVSDNLLKPRTRIKTLLTGQDIVTAGFGGALFSVFEQQMAIQENILKSSANFFYRNQKHCF
jgi:hypothetical protein